jgi:hypothetical protein
MTRDIKGIGLLISVLATTACGPASFDLVEGEDAALIQPTYQRTPRTGTTNPDSGNPVVCFPTDSQTPSISEKNGLQGDIRYLNDDQPRYSTVEDHLAYGTLVSNVDLFLANINVPNRRWSKGFEISSTEVVKRQDGIVLTEYFSLDLSSYLKLADTDPAGQYQFALISDDGATLEIQNSAGATVGSIYNGYGPEKMGCSGNVTLEKGRYYPTRVTYFQGPREHIALILMWRKVTNSQMDSMCGKGGMEFFHDSTQTPSKPTDNYKALLSAGWKVVDAKNFILESGNNPCIK